MFQVPPASCPVGLVAKRSGLLRILCPRETKDPYRKTIDFFGGSQRDRFFSVDKELSCLASLPPVGRWNCVEYLTRLAMPGGAPIWADYSICFDLSLWKLLLLRNALLATSARPIFVRCQAGGVRVPESCFLGDGTMRHGIAAFLVGICLFGFVRTLGTTLDASQASAAQRSFSRVKPEALRQTLTKGLKAVRPDQQEFIDHVVDLVESHKLPVSLVYAAVDWSRKRRSDYPFPYFVYALKTLAGRHNIVV